MMDVEQAFDNYVENVGGELVKKLLPKSPHFDNADYLFRNQQSEPVVAELKCLTKDLLEEGYQEKLNLLSQGWINRGLIPPFWGRHKFMSRDLPLECQNELFRRLGKPVRKHVAKANKQIRRTKEHFRLNEAKGLLLLVNDGNYSLESNVVLYLVDKALGQQYSSINSVVYFTVNMKARMPGVSRDVLIWVPAPRYGRRNVSDEFFDWLRDGWFKFHEKMIGEPVPAFTVENNKLIEHIKFVQPAK